MQPFLFATAWICTDYLVGICAAPDAGAAGAVGTDVDGIAAPDAAGAGGATGAVIAARSRRLFPPAGCA